MVVTRGKGYSILTTVCIHHRESRSLSDAERKEHAKVVVTRGKVTRF